MKAREELLSLLKREAFFKKRVRLSSGKISNYYIDVRRVSLSGRGLYLISSLLWGLVRAEKITALGGPTLGADPLVAGVCFFASLQGKILKGFLVRKEPKKYGQQKMIEGGEITPGDRIIIVDDVATSGSSLIRTVKVLAGLKIKPLKAIVVVDREEGAAKALAKIGCPFSSIFKKSDFI